MELHLHVTPPAHSGHGHEHDSLTRAIVQLLECKMKEPTHECVTKCDLKEFEDKIVALLDERFGSSDETVARLNALAEKISSFAPKAT